MTVLKKFAVTATMGLGLIAFSAPQADARSFYFGIGNGFYGGYGGYGGYGRGYGRGHRWHNTSHYDWHRGGFQRHYNHYDYVPGHYDFHRSGHRDRYHGGRWGGHWHH